MTTSRRAPIKTGSRWTKAWRALWKFMREKPVGGIAALILIGLMVIAVIGPFITPYDFIEQDMASRLEAPSWQHWMGTDQYGRDLFSRIIAGAQLALLIGVSSAFIGKTVGTIYGMVSGYYGGKIDTVMQRISDTLQAFPNLILIIAIVAVLGGSIGNLIFAISLNMIPAANRVARSVTLSLKGQQFIEAARAVGAKPSHIIFKHLFPNTLAPYIIILSTGIAGAILAESGLSFLGLGVPPPWPSWGRILSSAARLYGAPWMVIFPGLAISITVFASNFLGDALRDYWDPKQKKL